MVKIVANFFVCGVWFQCDFEDLVKIEPYRDTFYVRRGYLSMVVNGRDVYLHRFLARNPIGKIVDHVDRNKSNNQKDNLRVCSKKENSINVAPKGGKKYKGVRYYKQRAHTKTPWHAQAKNEEGKNKHLGYFETEIEGARAYNKYVLEKYGPYAWLNPV